MCGIVGGFKPTGVQTCKSEILRAMRDRMAHRGPDGAGLWQSSDERCVLGHRRLSIIDLSTAANQPMVNADGTVALVFNGEIYNHDDIRRELASKNKYRWQTDHSDTEVLLHAFEEWGLDCVQRFYGMYAFAVYDARDPGRPMLHLARDRVGKKPLYFTKARSGEWLFASEIRALLIHPDVHAEMDRTAFWHYLTFIVAPAPLTMFRGIFKLPAGHAMTIDHTGHARAWEFSSYRPNADLLTEKDLSDAEAADELTRLLKQAVRRRMVSDVPFGVLLSGGVDSSLIVALMSEMMDRPVTTFTIGYEGKEDYNEFRFAQRVSERFRTTHHEVRISRKQMQDFLPTLVQVQDEPIADNVCIPLYFLAELVRQRGTTVIQVGEGADENFLGYWWCDHYRQKEEQVYAPALRNARPGWSLKRFFQRPAAAAAMSEEDRAIRQRAAAKQELFWGGAACWWGEMRSRLTPDPSPFRQSIDCPVEGLLPDSHRGLDSHGVIAHFLAPLTGRLHAPEVLQKIPFMELSLRLPEHLLMRVDKLTMAHSIEARVPFLDHDVVEFARRLSPWFKLRNGVGKYVLKKAAEPYLERDQVYRKKQGFGAPMEEWFREGDFGRMCLAAFERSDLVREGYLDAAYFKSLLAKQIHGGGGYSFHLWTVLNAVLWHASWIEGRRDCLAA